MLLSKLTAQVLKKEFSTSLPKNKIDLSKAIVFFLKKKNHKKKTVIFKEERKIKVLIFQN